MRSRSLHKGRILGVFGLLLFLAGSASQTEARPGKLKISELIGSSDLIALGMVVRTEVAENGAGGVARVLIKKAYKGGPTSGHLDVSWSGEEGYVTAHSCLNSHWIFYLRKNESGKFEATRYGVSYWSLIADDETRLLVTPYTYPLESIDLDVPGLLTTATLAAEEFPHQAPSTTYKIQAIPIERLVAAIAKMSSGKKLPHSP